MALKDVKIKIQATNRMHKVTRAMEAVSAVKMRKTQQAAFADRAYARAALAILARLSGTADMQRYPLMKERTVTKTAILVMTSDKGLAGALNSGVIKAASEAIAHIAKENVQVFAYGRKAEEYFKRRGYAISASYENKHDDISLEAMRTLTETLAGGYVAGTFDELFVVYSNFRSTFEQVPTVRRLLPLSIEVLQKTVAEIVPARGKWSSESVVIAPPSYVVEPSAETVLDTLIPRLLSVALYHMLLEGKASEHSARMVAMKNASDKSKEVARDLTRKYNKIRQGAITREVSEIVGGREALASS